MILGATALAALTAVLLAGIVVVFVADALRAYSRPTRPAPPRPGTVDISFDCVQCGRVALALPVTAAQRQHLIRGDVHAVVELGLDARMRHDLARHLHEIGADA